MQPGRQPRFTGVTATAPALNLAASFVGEEFGSEFPPWYRVLPKRSIFFDEWIAFRSRESTMAVLLFPGRHLLSTRFQERYLRCHLQTSVEDMPLLRARTCGGRIEEVVFAITSANQSNSRFNPMPLEIRAVGVDPGHPISHHGRRLASSHHPSWPASCSPRN